MEEQTTAQQAATSDAGQPASFDGTEDSSAYTGYDEDTSNPAMSYEDEDEYEGQTDEEDYGGEIEPDGARLGSDGNVEFGEEFFGDVHEKNDPEPNYYTDEELRNTPYEQWDTKRLSGDISKFVPIVQDQVRQRQAQSRAQTIENIPMPQDIQEVKPYTPHELSEDAMHLACEKLGLEDPEDFDDYEADHRAAMQLAMNELMEKRNAEVQSYQRGRDEWGQLQKFNASLSQQADFNEFNEWYTGKLREAGVTAEQVNAGLYQYARRNGNRFSVIPQIIGTWYSEYQRERGGGRQPRYDAQTSRYPRYDAQTSRYPQAYSGAERANPPVLESTRGNDYGGRRRVNLQTFGDMDSDEQASALMRMGLV